MSNRFSSGSQRGFSTTFLQANRGLLIGGILFLALVAFEIFNFDTTQFALESLLGNVTFLGLQWATILAIAFCAIDFAGLNRLFTPEGSSKEHREVWFLMGAWLLGATLNAIMTWWAVSVTLLGNNLGNEVLSRQQILRYVPIFVAVLVWLTRILFIGSFSIAGEAIFSVGSSSSRKTGTKQGSIPRNKTRSPRKVTPSRIKAAPKPTYRPAPKSQPAPAVNPVPESSGSSTSRSSRVRQRPPLPNSRLRNQSTGMQAGSQN